MLTAWIVELRAFIRQLVLVTEKVNSPESKFFSAVACLKTDIAEFSHPLDQGSQEQCHLRFCPLVIDEWRKHISVHPLRGSVHINQEPPSGGTPQGALEGGINVLLSAAAIKRQRDPIVNDLVIVGQTVKVPAHAGI
jgi:hypothetical protein